MRPTGRERRPLAVPHLRPHPWPAARRGTAAGALGRYASAERWRSSPACSSPFPASLAEIRGSGLSRALTTAMPEAAQPSRCSVRSSRNSVSPVASIRRRYGRHRPHPAPQPVARAISSSPQPPARARGRTSANGIRRQTHIVTRIPDTATGWWGGRRSRSRERGLGAGRRPRSPGPRPPAAECAGDWT